MSCTCANCPPKNPYQNRAFIDMSRSGRGKCLSSRAAHPEITPGVLPPMYHHERVTAEGKCPHLDSHQLRILPTSTGGVSITLSCVNGCGVLRRSALVDSSEEIELRLKYREASYVVTIAQIEEVTDGLR